MLQGPTQTLSPTKMPKCKSPQTTSKYANGLQIHPKMVTNWIRAQPNVQKAYNYNQTPNTPTRAKCTQKRSNTMHIDQVHSILKLDQTQTDGVASLSIYL